MKPRYFLACAVSLVALGSAAPARAAETTEPPVEPKPKNQLGGYGAPEIKGTLFFGDPALLFGSQGGFVVKHRWIFGGAGYGLVSNTDGVVDGRKLPMSLGYGLGRVGYIFWHDADVHPVLLVGGGGGGMSIGDEEAEARSGTFFVGEPQLEIEANAGPFLRIAVAGSYRFVTKTAGISWRELSGPSASFLVRVGSF
jgi:hypothetical protein